MDERDLDFEGTRLHYRTGGDGQPVLLMHGWGCRAATLASIERTALDAGCRVVNVDFPGFGDSDEPSQTWGVERYADCIERLVQEEHLQGATLLGHSFGGRVALTLGARHPDMWKRIILVDSAGVKPRRSLAYYRRVYTFKAARRLLELVLGKEKAAPWVEKMRASRGSGDYAGSSPMMRSILSRVVNEDLCHLMPAIKAPTLLIWGENDTATPIADARRMEALIPGAALVTFPGCGHYSFLDNPRQFAAVLRSFLNS